MRLIFSVLTAIVLIAAALFFFAPLLISTDEVRDQLLAQVESVTGYRLRVDGPVKFSLFPSLDLVAKDVGVAQPGASGAEVAMAKELRFGLVWSALWGGKVQLTEVTLIDPVIAMPAKTMQAQAGAEGVGPPGQAGPRGSSAAAALQNLTLDKLVIENGTVILPASEGAQGKRIEGLNLEASLPAFDSALSFDMKGIYDGKPVHIAGSVEKFGPFLSGAAAPVEIAFDIPEHHRDQIILTGTATYKDGTFALKRFTAKTPNAVLGGDAVYKGSILTLHPFTAMVYGNTLSGALAANLSGRVPAVNVALTADTLDLNKLLAGAGARRAAVDGEAKRIGKSLADAGSILGIAESRAETSTGGSAGQNWSDARIDYAPLRAVNAKIKLTARQLIYDNIKMNPGTIEGTLTDGKLNANIPSFKLYNGSGAASLAVDASGRTPAQRIKLSLADFQALPLLRDAAGFENIEGTGAINLDLAASGASQHVMVQTLGGNAKLDFANGAIRGINVAKTVRNLTKNTLSGWQDSAAEKTDFATLGASFQLAGGQAQTNDLHLVGPLVRMTGAGSVNLPARTLQMRVDPKIVASLEGQGGQTDLQGLGVPVVISGPWASPRIYPDIKGILENPVAAYEQLNKINQLGGGLVKLPSVDELGEKAGLPGGVPLTDIIKDGKIDRDALQKGAIEGLGQLLNKQTDTKPAAAPQPVEPVRTAPAEVESAIQPVETPPPVVSEPKPKAKTKPAPDASTGAKKDEKRAASKPDRPVDKTKQKQQQKKQQKRDAEDAAKQILQNLLGN